MTSQFQVANRVTQLESRQLDRELDSMVDNFVEQLEITAYSEELKAILKLYLSTSSVMIANSPGMRVYNLTYCDGNKFQKDAHFHRPSRRKLAMLAAMNLVAAYSIRRQEMFERLLNSRLSKLNIPWLNLDNTTLCFRFMSVVNFMVFLKKGMYLSLTERIFGLSSVISSEHISNNDHLNRIQMDFLYSQMIWRALAEFLTTVIPMVNMERIKNNLLKIFDAIPELNSKPSISEKISAESNSKRCAICLKQPFNPYVIGCRHVFCYYCLQSAYESDPSNGYVCLSCEYRTLDQDSLRRFKVLENL